MKKILLFFLLASTTIPVLAQSRATALQMNAEIGCQFRQAACDIPGYDPHSYTPAGFCGDIGLGLRATRFFFLGVGVGAHSEYALKEVLYTSDNHATIPMSTYRWVLPVYADIRLYIPTKTNMNPFVEGSGGYYWGLTGNQTIAGAEEKFMPQNGIFAQAGAGVDFRRFMVSIGYRYYQNAEGGLPHYGYAKIGIRLGKNVDCDKKQ